jgi:hypothetical protein
MKLGNRARGYVAAALAVAACIGTWAAVVSADEGLGRAAGVYVDSPRYAVCYRAVSLTHRVTGAPLDGQTVCGY